MQLFEIAVLIISVIGAVFFIRKDAPTYIVAACLALALICLYALGLFNFQGEI